MWIIDLDENRTQRKPRPIMPPSKVVSNEHFVTFVDWTASDQLLVVWTLRNQRRSIVGICEATNNWRCQEVRSTYAVIACRSQVPSTIQKHCIYQVEDISNVPQCALAIVRGLSIS